MSGSHTSNRIVRSHSNSFFFLFFFFFPVRNFMIQLSIHFWFQLEFDFLVYLWILIPYSLSLSLSLSLFLILSTGCRVVQWLCWLVPWWLCCRSNWWLPSAQLLMIQTTQERYTPIRIMTMIISWIKFLFSLFLFLFFLFTFVLSSFVVRCLICQPWWTMKLIISVRTPATLHITSILMCAAPWSWLTQPALLEQEFARRAHFPRPRLALPQLHSLFLAPTL